MAKGNPAEAGRTGNLLQAGLWENILQTVTEMWRAIVQRLFAFFEPQLFVAVFL